MTPAEILRLADPFLSMRDTQAPMIRGADDLVAFAEAVIAKHEEKRWRVAYDELQQAMLMEIEK